MTAERRSRFVMVNGVKTHYTESGGDGPVILGMHGGGHGSSGAAGLGRLFELLGDRYRVIGLDSVGAYGLTDPVPLHDGLQSRVDHAAAFLETLCIEKATLLGNSQGAWCVARYAITHPDRVENVVLLSSLTIGSALGIPLGQTEGMKLLQGYDGTRAGMERLMKGLCARPEVVTDALIDLRQASATRPGAMDAFAASDKSIAAVRNNPLLFASFDMRETLPLLAKAIPTVFIWGHDDIFAPPELGKKLEAILPDVKFHWIPQAGHQAQTDQPEKVAQIVDDLIQKKALASA